MRKILVVLMIAVAVFSAPAAASQDINLDINFDFSGIFGGDEKEQEEKNNTYGERVGGQSVHTEQQPSEAQVGKNNDDFQITEDTSEEQGFFASLLGGLFG